MRFAVLVAVAIFGFAIVISNGLHASSNLRMHHAESSYISGLTLRVKDIKRSVSFYRNTFDMEVFSESANSASLGFKSDDHSVELSLLQSSNSIDRGDVSFQNSALIIECTGRCGNVMMLC
jgi:catechol-2,3-dioxygenase